MNMEKWQESIVKNALIMIESAVALIRLALFEESNEEE
jgi:hypothetical protein